MGDLHGVAESPRRRLSESVVASATLSILFLVIYGGTNWITSKRSDVGVWYYSWERNIPFVPAMVIPYMSIDLFFVVAPFLCRSRCELRMFSKRILLAMLVAGFSFLLMPLRLAHERPPLTGSIGYVFGWFFESDLPFNLCPSLHIALRTILAEIYSRHSRGVWNLASHIWFSLIGFSTLLTYQHHVVDVIGGFLLASTCFYLIPSSTPSGEATTNRRIGMYYFLLVIVAAVASLMSTKLIVAQIGLMWLAANGVLAGAAYFGWVRELYGKENGRLTISTRIIMAPLLLGQRLSLAYYQRKCHAWDEVIERLWIGRKLSDREATEAVSQGVIAILDLTAEFSEARPFREREYFNVPILDLTAPTPKQIEQCLSFISRHIRSGTVLVHCKIGYSRTAVVAAAYLLRSGVATTATDAVDMLRRSRPSIIIRPEAMKAIEQFAAFKLIPNNR